ncbi:uncharacterized protein LOC135168675 isoform X1 [Diachasmimorpha longicaudata]|uniref:uncharacterized protein LOC135168675 isoform X1 n=1 Tax=Diachasmimorpha longicaudata TaxID=58733 RepID=UPI0030B8737A
MIELNDDRNYFVINQVERMIRERWRIIKCTTKYGWLMAYYQGSKISQERMKILVNLANKIGQKNCEIAVARIRKLSYGIHPNQIPIVAEAILNEIYTILIFKQRREFRWEMKHLVSKSPTVFTISNDIF